MILILIFILKFTWEHILGKTYINIHIVNKVLSENGNLKKHMRTHFGEKTISVHLLWKLFFTENGTLKTHLTTYTGEKPYQCDHCGQGFILNNSLKNHMRTHSGEKTISVHLLWKLFLQRMVLLKPIWEHTLEKSHINVIIVDRDSH